MRFDLVDLRLFVSSVESGSITAGAARCHLSLPAASARLRAMEGALGVALLTRGPRGVAPTGAGSTLLHHARAVMARLARMEAELEPLAEGRQARIRLLGNTAALATHLPDLLATFLAAHPDVDLDLEARPSHAIVQALLDGRADLGVLADSTALREIEARPFRRDPLVVIAAREADAPAAAAACDFEDVIDGRFVGLGADAPLQQHLQRQAAMLGRTLSLRIRATDLDTVCALVARGLGIAIVPRAALARTRMRRALAVTPLRDAWADRTLHLCARRFDTLDAPARALATLLLAPPPASSGVRAPRLSADASRAAPSPRSSPAARGRR